MTEHGPQQTTSCKTLQYQGLGSDKFQILKRGKVIKYVNLLVLFTTPRGNDGLAIIEGNGIPFAEVERLRRNPDVIRAICQTHTHTQQAQVIAAIRAGCFKDYDGS